MPKSESHFVLVDDSRLMALCWGHVLNDRQSLVAFSTPREFLEAVSSLDQKSILILDVDFAGLDPMSGVELAQELRLRGIENPIFLYSGFSDTVTNTLVSDGVINGIFSKDLSPREMMEHITLLAS